MASHYRAGADVERLIAARARRAGCAAWRVAGSKGEGATDVLVLSPWTGLLALNVKRGCWAPPAERVAMRSLEKVGALPLLVCAHIRNGVGTIVVFRELGDGLDMGEPTELEPWGKAWLAR